MEKLSWKDVFYPHKQYGWILDVYEAAFDAGYSYFIWNDIVYDVKTKHATSYNIKNIK